MNNIIALSKNLSVTEEDARNTIANMISMSKSNRGQASDAEIMLVATICSKYDLNPMVKEIAPFIGKGGRLQLIVMIDGWYKIVNRQKNFDGLDFTNDFDQDGNLQAITCTMHLKDRTKPISCTEYLCEMNNNSDVWNKYPKRMLRNKAYIQAARMAFGLSELVDEDYREIKDINAKSEYIAPESTLIEHKEVATDNYVNILESIKAKSEEELKEKFAKIKIELDKSNSWMKLEAVATDIYTKKLNEIKNNLDDEFED